ncbi:MAG: sensor histidine kinase [Janthinobacterium lividum]
MDEILSEWDEFAQSLGPAGTDMPYFALRDHAEQILRAIALDIETHQSLSKQIQKSRGSLPNPNANETAASIHGGLRQERHFSLIQLSAEFRALRATVLRLWLPTIVQMSDDEVYSMIRFNEAIDQALSESIVAYCEGADQSRELFLAILGHDLRAPLATMTSSGEMLQRAALPAATVLQIGARIQRSAKLMVGIMDDLLGFTRTKLGVGIPTTLAIIDLQTVCQSAIDDAKAVHPATRFVLTTSGSLLGAFDSVRVTQLLTNLLKNAAQYGAADQVVEVDVNGSPDAVTMKIVNHGDVIPGESLESIFLPLVRLAPNDENGKRPRTSLGLGLYVARETALAHGGTISVTSDVAAGTTFRVCLPKGQ